MSTKALIVLISALETSFTVIFGSSNSLLVGFNKVGSSNGIYVEECMASGRVASVGRPDDDIGVLCLKRLPQFHLLQIQAEYWHEHRFVSHLDCVVHLQHRPWETSTVTGEDI